MSEKSRNNSNSNNPLTFRRTDGGKNKEKIVAKEKLSYK